MTTTAPLHQTAGGEADDPTQLVLRNARISAAPYLPPPLLNAIYITDSYLHSNHASFSTTYCHSEPSMSILSAFFSAYIVLKFIQALQFWWSSTTKRSTAHLGGEENAVLSGLSQGNKQRKNDAAQEDATPQFDETVVICGASGAGKTALLHCLCNENDGDLCQPPITTTSLVANVGYMCIPSDSTDKAKDKESMAVRLVDYPGHPSLSTQLTSLLLPDQTSRVVFAIDATKPVTNGVAILYKAIFTNSQVRSAWETSGKKMVILIVCTKEDDKRAKNHKRMKIQIRNELDRLRKVDSAMEDVTGNGSTPISTAKGKSIDLDDLGHGMPELHFVETGIGTQGKDNGLEAVREFVRTGKVL